MRNACLIAAGIAFSATSWEGLAGESALLRDKTLVAWASPANLTQRGGSVLTIEDRRNGFDAIVFGEIAPGKWMAGSDMFSRTLRDQSAVAPETADSRTLVQVAVVYRGNQITQLRNGVALSRYETSSPPRAFDEGAMTLFGRRHRRQGDSAHFAGFVEDARIYDRALTAAEISALTPDAESTIKPWAWWTFDDSSGADRTGRFPMGRLTGGSRIESGRLILDGVDGMLLCRTGKEPLFVPETPALPAQIPPTWLTYHLAHPGPGVGMPGDPNCAFYWKGRYHLHYIYNHQDGFSFAHVSSADLVHWKWHPTTLTPPNTDHGMFSGTGFFTREEMPAIIYHGEGSGRNQIAFAQDDRLEKWSKPIPLEPTILPGQDPSSIAHWDPDCWLDRDTYYALSGGSPGSGKPPTLFRSKDLKKWDYLGLFLSHDMPDVQKDEDISCPNFFRIGSKWMLLCISHNKGCRYYLGRWENEKFVPESHHRMNWNGWDFFAPESVLTPDGRRVMWAWCHIGDGLPIQTAIQSLPREISLPRDGILRIKPLRELATLRSEPRRLARIPIEEGMTRVLEGVSGDSVEIMARFRKGTAKKFGLNVFADSTGAGGLPILVDTQVNVLQVGNVKAPFTLKPREDIVLRVFLDKNLVEVFANERQAIVAVHRYAPENLYVSLTSFDGICVLENLKFWRMRSIYQ